MILAHVFIFTKNLIGKVGCFDDISIAFQIDIITKVKNFGEECVPCGNEIIVLSFIKRHGVFHGILIHNLILLLHSPVDIDLVLGENIFEGGKCLLASVQGNLVQFELRVGGQELELIKGQGCFDLV